MNIKVKHLIKKLDKLNPNSTIFVHDWLIEEWKDLNDLCVFMANKNWKEAMYIYESLDSDVRDSIPNKIAVKLVNNYNKLLDE